MKNVPGQVGNRNCSVVVNRNCVVVVLLFAVLAPFTRPQNVIDDHAMPSPCPLLIVLPFSDARASEYNDNEYGWSKWTPQMRGRQALTYLAAIQLAVAHFNSRNNSIVENLEQLTGDQCTVQFPWPEDAVGNMTVAETTQIQPGSTMVVDSATWNIGTMSNILEAYLAVHSSSEERKEKTICAIIGPSEGRAAEGAGLFAAAREIPILPFLFTLPRYTNWNLFPTVVLSNVDMYSVGLALVEYLQREGAKRDYAAILYTEDGYGTALANTIIREGNIRGLQTERFTFRSNRSMKSLPSVIENMKVRGFHTFIVASERTQFLPLIATVADRAGLIGDEYLWIFEDTMVPADYLSDHLQETPESSLDLLLKGAGVLRVLDGYAVPSKTSTPGSKFMKIWEEQTPRDVRLINAMNPKAVSEKEHVLASNDFFIRNKPAQGSSFLYDAIMTLGIAKCRLQRRERIRANDDDFVNGTWNEKREQPDLVEGERKEGPNVFEQRDEEKTKENFKENNDENDPVKRIDIVIEMLRTAFTGPSGNVSYVYDGNQARPKKRSAESVSYGVYNIRAELDADGLHRYKCVLTSVKPVGGRWKNVDGATFLYFDGTSNMPKPLHDVADENFLPTATHKAGIALTALSLAVNTAVAGVMWMRRDALQMSQPIFLSIICAGSSIMSVTILTLSFDEQHGWTTRQLSMACIASPWLFFVGYVMVYSALFSKLWRINRMLRSRDPSERNLHLAIAPVIALVGASTAVLTVWTIIDPLRWRRETLSTFPLETYGECFSDRATMYLTTLSGIMIVATCMAILMAWKTRGINQKLTEARSIFYAAFAQMQTWAVGVPLLFVIKDGSVEASYVGRILLIWTFAVSTVVVYVGPRILEVVRDCVSAAASSRRDSQSFPRSIRMWLRGHIQSSITESGVDNLDRFVSNDADIDHNTQRQPTSALLPRHKQRDEGSANQISRRKRPRTDDPEGGETSEAVMGCTEEDSKIRGDEFECEIDSVPPDERANRGEHASTFPSVSSMTNGSSTSRRIEEVEETNTRPSSDP